jgi:NCS1 family nucleobase:cation symporter-1
VAGSATQIRNGDIVTLEPNAVAEAGANTALWNDDLRPCTLAEHAWKGSAFASLWLGMCLCVPTYSLASGMIALGMNWYEAVAAVFIGSVTVLVPILLVSHAGTRYGIPYPVFARLWFGVRGAHLPALARALIAAGWFGINSWFGGLALDAIATRVIAPWGALGGHVAIAFAVFWIANVAIAMRGPQAIGKLAAVAAPTVGIGALCLFGWAVSRTGSVGAMLAAPATLHGVAFWGAFFGAVIGVISFWATMALNIPDFSRYARTQRGQSLGQAFSMPFAMAIFAFVGIAVTSATQIVYGAPLWNPVALILKFPTPVVVIAGAVVILSSITINVGANVVAPARAFENLRPSKITFALGAILTGVLSLAMQPWYVLAVFSNYIFNWLGTYGALLGPIDGIAIADYWLVRSQRIDLLSLYLPTGRYAYGGGFNIRAIVAVVIGWAVALVGLVVPALHFLWVGGWLFGLVGGFVAYALLMRRDTSLVDTSQYAEMTRNDEGNRTITGIAATIAPGTSISAS